MAVATDLHRTFLILTRAFAQATAQGRASPAPNRVHRFCSFLPHFCGIFIIICKKWFVKGFCKNSESPEAAGVLTRAPGLSKSFIMPIIASINTFKIYMGIISPYQNRL
jgi:hypothetical protein